jgi:hypothetical protein
LSQELESIGHSALERFIDTFNSRDAVRWAGSLQFPHVRPSPRGTPVVIPSAEKYADAFDYQRIIDSGWDHSEFDERRVLHVSADKIHAAGQWSRYSAAGEKFLTNQVVYIVTRLGDRWGIQSRFGADSRPVEDRARVEARLFEVIRGWASARGDPSSAAPFIRDPAVEVHPGRIDTFPPGEGDFSPKRGAGSLTVEDLESIQLGELAANVAGDFTRTAEGGPPQHLRGVLLLTEEADRWAIRAASFIAAG